MTFETQHPFAQLAIDVAVSLALFVAACVLSGWLQDFVTPNSLWMNPFWFAMGMLPWLLYMRYRDQVNFDKWDIVVFFLPLPLVLGVTGTIFGHHFAHLAIFPFVLVAFSMRRLLLPQRRISSRRD
ncbi:MAG: hypothetical protein KDB22_10370 [Planctomycetales bacterium]|nr:hypothetical protein [Planctomycetales bacterium]